MTYDKLLQLAWEGAIQRWRTAKEIERKDPSEINRKKAKEAFADADEISRICGTYKAITQ